MRRGGLKMSDGDWVEKLYGKPVDDTDRKIFIGFLSFVVLGLVIFTLWAIGSNLADDPPTAQECYQERVQDAADGWPDSAVFGKEANCLREAREAR